MSDNEIVKSEYVLDPETGLLVRRTGTSLHRMFEKGVEPLIQRAFKPGKLNRDSFIDKLTDPRKEGGQIGLTAEEEEAIRVGRINNINLFSNLIDRDNQIKKPQARVGKLDIAKVFSPEENNSSCVRGDDIHQLSVGKLRIQEDALFSSTETPAERPQIPVGKLDVKQVFSPPAPSEEKSPVIVGKLDTRNLFPAAAAAVDEKPIVTVGKLDTKGLFGLEQSAAVDERRPAVGRLDIGQLFVRPEEEPRPVAAAVVTGKLDVKNIFNPAGQSPEERSPPISVGRLDVRALFLEREKAEPMAAELTERPHQVGRLSAQTIFSGNGTTEAEAEATRLYRPSVQPRKLKLENIFTAASGADFSPKGDSKCAHEDPATTRVGKIDTSNLFRQMVEEEEQREAVKVGRLHNPFTEVLGDREEQQHQLAGARRINKGTRISCLIENLATDRPNDDSAPEDSEVAELRLGRDRVAQLQNIFNQDSRQRDSTDSGRTSSDYLELKDEGIVSANLQRFSTGSILGSQPDGLRKTSLETNYIDRKHIEAVAAKFEGQEMGTSVERMERHVGKIRSPDTIFQPARDDQPIKEVKVGRLTSDLLKIGAEEDKAKSFSAPPTRVGKLNTDNIFPKAEPEPASKPEVRVGKLQTKNLFPTKPCNPETETVKVSVGRVSQDWLQASRTDQHGQEEEQEEEGNVDREPLVPVGTVQKSASVFLGQPRIEETRRNLPLRTSSSCADSSTAELQRKYQEQTSSSLHRKKTTEQEKKREVKSMNAQKLRVEKDNIMQAESTRTAQNVSSESKKLWQDSVATVAQDTSYTHTLYTTETKEFKHFTEAPKTVPIGGPSDKGDLLVGGIEDARAKFFCSMMADSEKRTSSSAQRTGTSVLPTLGEGGNSSRGKALFQRCAAAQTDEKQEERPVNPLLPGLDFQQIEEEFERIHNEMLASDTV